jgi:NAD(P)-dependent dehydrogenase (short-subunit alcohol dehydrogenase family)
MTAVLVTGASTGIGRACVERLTGRGMVVFAGVRRDTDGKELERDLGPRVVPLILDVTDSDQIDDARRQVEQSLGRHRFVGLVNNAGVAIGGPVEYLPIELWREQFEVNLFGLVAVTQAFIDLLRPAPGRIVVIGSISGRLANPLMAPYAGSKHAVEALGEALRHELAPWGIRTSVVEPGAVRTPVWDKGRALAERLERELPPEGLERYRSFIDLVRRGIDRQEDAGIEPDRVAAVVERALLCTDPRARYPVGPDAHVTAALSRLLPDRLRDRAVHAFMDRI